MLSPKVKTSQHKKPCILLFDYRAVRFCTSSEIVLFMAASCRADCACSLCQVEYSDSMTQIVLVPAGFGNELESLAIFFTSKLAVAEAKKHGNCRLQEYIRILLNMIWWKKRDNNLSAPRIPYPYRGLVDDRISLRPAVVVFAIRWLVLAIPLR